MAVKTNYEKNGNQYYRVTVSVGKDADGKLIRKEFYGKSKKEAEAKRDEYMGGLKKGLAIDYDKAQLGEIMHLWLFETLRPSEMKPSTFDRYEGIYRNYIKKSELNSLRLSDVRSLQIQQYYNRVYESGVSPKTIKNINKLLRFFFNYCIAEDYIIKNPCFKLTIPGKIEEKEKASINPFTDDEIKKIKASLIGNRMEVPVLLTFGTGLREGEMLDLSFEDVDIENEELGVFQN